MPETEIQTILVIDDDWLNHEVLESILGYAGHKVLQAQRGNEGLKIAVTELPDLIIADVNLPDIDGFILCESLKKNPKTQHIPIILISGHIQGQLQRQKAKTAGAFDFIERILKPDDLLTYVNAALASTSPN